MMKAFARRTAMASVLMVLVLVGVGVTANPAAAAPATACRLNTKEIKRSASNKKLLSINLCVQRIGTDQMRAYASISITDRVGSADIVYDATLNVRLEYDDSVIESAADSLGYDINDAYDTYWTVSTDEFESTVRGNWSADGVVYYDIVGDGKGVQTWELYGSPLI